ncbi:GLPGLI family protein [Polaribacter sp. MSW13]|uniref:GLPGLI family protein n=1 Tax=Polaribacter marinus TaxID=2916838 RepID=A0A9X1VPJ8_9FLAO|nr:GLPGLI family protein [Polaribacter marinus]MCI2230409.1 GLPGLI family protein [Polaribacter marinus]
MKKTIPLLMIFISLGVLAQENLVVKITYSEKLNFDLPVVKTSELFFKSTQSYYLEKKSEQIVDDKKFKVKGKKNNTSNKIININLEKDSIFTKTSLDKTFFLVQEKLNKIVWKIHEKTYNIILGFKSTKATGYFRGRIYTVWFTKEIPTTFGPWKLNGLPGLILEAKDNLNEIFFIAEKIEYLKKEEAPFNFLKKNSYEKISLKEFNKKLNEKLESKMQQIISKLPKGSKVTSYKFKKYKGIELKYEWEKDK